MSQTGLKSFPSQFPLRKATKTLSLKVSRPSTAITSSIKFLNGLHLINQGTLTQEEFEGFRYLNFFF